MSNKLKSDKNLIAPISPWRNKIHTIIFGTDTPAGRLFDIILIWAIVLSVIVVCFESIREVRNTYGTILLTIEWIFTFLFSIEFILRVVSLKNPKSYIFSFYGIVDLLAILPSYLGLFFAGAHSLMVIRSIRLLRVFRLFKLTRYVGEADVLIKALVSGRHKIMVFVLAVVTVALFMGAVMFVVEGEANGFTSIPKGMYWAIVTMTTVGYGDLAPQTDLGKTLASLLMIMGYGIIAVPTGIVSVEMANVGKIEAVRQCNSCLLKGHLVDAVYCRICSHKL